MGQFSKNYRTFYPKNVHYALKNMGLESGIRDPGSRIREKPIPGPGVKQAPDPDPQHCLLEKVIVSEKFVFR